MCCFWNNYRLQLYAWNEILANIGVFFFFPVSPDIPIYQYFLSCVAENVGLGWEMPVQTLLIKTWIWKIKRSTVIWGIINFNQICTLGIETVSPHLYKCLMQNLQYKQSALGDLLTLPFCPLLLDLLCSLTQNFFINLRWIIL